MWKCPACQTSIRLDTDVPRAQTVYRCHVCRLELVLDESVHRLVVAPLPSERAPETPPFPPAPIKRS